MSYRNLYLAIQMLLAISCATRASGLLLPKGHQRALKIFARDHSAREVVQKLVSFRLFGTSSDETKGCVSPKKKVIFLGTPDVAANCLRILQAAAVLQDSNFDIIAVVTQPPAPVGRTKKITASPVQTTAEELSIPVFSPEKAKDEDFLSALEALCPDLCITAAYGNYLPKRFLSIPKCGTVNIHPSLLPKYRGAAPAQRCLEAGDATSGVSVLFTVQKMDAGPIIKQHTCVLSGQEKAPDFLVDMFSIGTKLLIEALPPIFSGDILRDVIQQDESQATAADKLSPLEARTDFSCLSALQVHNKARGLAGWPGLWSTFTATPEGGAESEPQRIKIITTVLKDWTAVTPTRDVLVIRDGKRDLLQVVCGDGSMLGISEVQPSGKKVMPVRDFVNGLRGSTLRWTVPPLPEASDA